MTELAQPPSDWISNLEFYPERGYGELLAATSWDKTLRLFDVNSNTLRSLYQTDNPLLTCSFVGSPTTIACAGLGMKVKLYDFVNESETLLGIQRAPISVSAFHCDSNLLFTGSWDSNVCVWDLRMANLRHRLEFQGPIMGMDVSPARSAYGKLIVVDNTRKVYIHDLRMINIAEEVRENVISHQPRVLKTLPSGLGFAIGTTEGRVAYQYFNPEKNETADVAIPHPIELRSCSSYTFKCHRVKEEEQEIIHPVHDISFSRTHGAFATCGGDGGLAFWDGERKKRTWRLTKLYPTSISSVSFNATTTKLAFSLSDDASSGKILQGSKIFIKDVLEEEVKVAAKV